MKKILINNRGLLRELDKLATQVLHHPNTFSFYPLPNISMARLREVMDADDGTIEESNGIDYSGREWITNEYMHYSVDNPFDRQKGLRKSFNQTIPCLTKKDFLAWLKKTTNNESWEMDTWEIQPERHGWTPWHSGKNKPVNFVRFIWNSGKGITHYISHDNKHYKYQDSKYTGQKCWNCLVGKLDGRQYLADRNLGNHKRIVIQFTVESKYNKAIDQFMDVIQNGDEGLGFGAPLVDALKYTDTQQYKGW